MSHHIATLNIGLLGATRGLIRAEDARAAIVEAGLTLIASRVHHGADEAVLVAQVGCGATQRDVHRCAYRIAELLDQDCIAVWWPFHVLDNYGELIGPRAAAWGHFQPNLFRTMEGGTLTRPAPVRDLAKENALMQRIWAGKALR